MVSNLEYEQKLVTLSIQSFFCWSLSITKMVLMSTVKQALLDKIQGNTQVMIIRPWFTDFSCSMNTGHRPETRCFKLADEYLTVTEME